MLDLKELFAQLVACDRYRSNEKDGDITVLKAIQQRERDPLDRNKSLVSWLQGYSVFMSFTSED